MPVTNTKTKWSSGKLQYTDNSGTAYREEDGANLKTTVLDGGALEIAAGARLHQGGRLEATVSADKTLALATDAGVVQMVDTDGKVITLPATHVGDSFTIENIGADGAVGISVSPQAADKISGAGLTAADNKDLINTKATAMKGDYVKLIADGVDGFVVVEMRGLWAREA